MSPATIFSIANTFVLIGWLLLIFAPKWEIGSKYVVTSIVLILSLVYAFLVIPGLPSFDPASFSSLSQVKALFQDDAMLTAGRIHYLAFDLFIGSIIVQKGLALKIPRWQYTVCLPFTFMFGPIGLLLFYLFKALKK